MKIFKNIIFIVLSLSLSLIAKDVAIVTALNGKAFIERNNTKIAITLGSKLQEKDTIITNRNAKVQIIFTDETIITIGKDSNFSISKFLYEDETEPVAKFSMIKGAMRAITGKIGEIAPEKFTVTAKTATIGIRGTNFTTVVSDSGITQVYCTFGAISITVNGTQHIVNQGFFIAIYPNGKTVIKAFQAEDLKKVKAKFAKSSNKIGAVDDDSSQTDQTQIDTTTEDLDNIATRNITNSIADAEQLTTIDSSLADILAGYTMSDAVYNGSYTITQNETFSEFSSDATSTSKLEVDFGTDTISLTLTSDNGYNTIFNSTSSITDTNFTVELSSGGGASGTFGGSTGNSATGTFNIVDGSQEDKGTFNVTSSQTLK